ncbi:MAG: TonB-dependent receptor plug domain-containing protein, partial [Niabella sp.]
ENGDLGRLNPDDIASISVVKDSANRSVYGPKAGVGVIFVTTKPEKPANDAMTFTAKGDKVYVRATNKDMLNEMTADTIVFAGAGKSISAKGNVQGTVYSAQSLQGKEAVKVNDKLNEVVVVGYGTKNKNISSSLQGKVSGMQVHSSGSQLESVYVSGYGYKKKENTMLPEVLSANSYYVLNGKRAKIKEVRKLQPGAIRSVDILKGDQAQKYYGSKAKQGAIVITTR